METKNLIMTIVGVTVSVIIVAACLMPVLSDAVATTDTFTNDGWFNLSTIKDTDDGTVTIAWDHTEPGVLTINSVDITMPETDTLPFTIMCGETWALRMYNAVITGGYGIDLIDTNANSVLSASTTNEKDFSGSLTSGTASFTVTGDDTPTTETYTECYYVDPDGPYVLKKANSPAYLNGESVIVAVGRTGWSKGAFNSYINGSIEDGVTVTIINRAYTVSDIEINYTVDNNHNDLYKFSSVVFTVTKAGEPPDTLTATYSQVIVPAEVTAERVIHFTPEQIAVFSAIPLLIIVAILLMAVSIINKGRE